MRRQVTDVPVAGLCTRRGTQSATGVVLGIDHGLAVMGRLPASGLPHRASLRRECSARELQSGSPLTRLDDERDLSRSTRYPSG